MGSRGWARVAMDERLRDALTDQLFAAVLSLENTEECYRFFQDVCTVGELKALAQRLEVARMLAEGLKYDEIVARTGASTATISRVKRCLHFGADGYRLVLGRLGNCGDRPARARGGGRAGRQTGAGAATAGRGASGKGRRGVTPRVAAPD